MSGYALGLIETKGKLAAIEALDVALKSANVALLGIENATGALITVKLVGNVGAVRAAVDAARARAALLGKVIATRVIPRPAPGLLDMMGKNNPSAPLNTFAAKNTQDCDDESIVETTREFQPEAEPKLRPEPADELESTSPPSTEIQAEAPKKVATCNICHDPACARTKGEPGKHCLHSKKK